MTMPDDAHGNRIEPHREAAALRAENGLLREELAKLITDLDYLTTTVLPSVEAEYSLKIGCLEYEAFTLECEVRRARRRLELARSHVNRNENIPPAAIESALEDEFSRWQSEIEEMRRGLEAAREFERAPRLSAAETRELQTLYRRLARLLHPDLNPGQTERERNIWLRVADAYRDGALEELRALGLLLDGDPAADEGGGAHAPLLDSLRRRRDELRAHVERALAQMARVKSEPPYTLRRKLGDEQWLAARAADLREKIALLKEHRLMLDAAYCQLTGASTPPRPAGDEEWPEIICEA
jgi:hypothetical protein